MGCYFNRVATFARSGYPEAQEVIIDPFFVL